MASIDCKKMSMKAAGSMKRHLDQKERETAHHSNKNIDKSLSHLNYFIDCSGYSEMNRNLKNKLKEEDSLNPPERVKSDRNVLCSYYVVCPKALEDRQKDFFNFAYNFIDEFNKSKYGHSVMLGATVHLDEKHQYIDTGWEARESLYHAHIWSLPFAKWTDKKTVYNDKGKPLRDKNGKIIKENYVREGVNMKHFTTKEYLTALQREFDQALFKKFGVHYLTGEEPLKTEMTKLKKDSEIRSRIMTEVRDKAMNDAEQEINAFNSKIYAEKKKQKDEIVNLTFSKVDLEEENKQLKKRKDALKDDIEVLEQKIESLEQKYTELEKNPPELKYEIKEVNLDYKEELEKAYKWIDDMLYTARINDDFKRSLNLIGPNAYNSLVRLVGDIKEKLSKILTNSRQNLQK